MVMMILEIFLVDIHFVGGMATAGAIIKVVGVASVVVVVVVYWGSQRLVLIMIH